MSRTEKWLLAAIALWLATCVYCLTQLNPDLNPTPEPVPDAVPVMTVQRVMETSFPEEPEEEPVPEEEPALDLTKWNQIENATLTHYCICQSCCGKDESHPAYGITASGRKAEPYISVAVDPHLIPLGSTVYIDYGFGELLECRADDTGSAVAGAHIDLCAPDHQTALEMGKQTVRVYWKEGA